MFITAFKDIYSPVVPTKCHEMDWYTAAKHFVKLHNVPNKESTPMFNLWQFDTSESAKLRESDNKISRCIANCKTLSGLVLDFDGKYDEETNEIIENVSIVDAALMFGDYEFVLYTTYRHQLIDIGGVKINKFRMILPFETPVLRDEVTLRMDALVENIKYVDRASFSKSQPFYMHSAAIPETAFAFHNPAGKYFDILKYTPTVKKQYDNSYSIPNPEFKHSSNYTASVLNKLGEIHGLHYENAMALANCVKGCGGQLDDYLTLCASAFASDSSHRKTTLNSKIAEFNRAHVMCTKETINKFLVGHGVSPLPIYQKPEAPIYTNDTGYIPGTVKRKYRDIQKSKGF